MGINFEILDLRILVAVIDLEGFRRAAEALNLSQSALSRRIKRLEAAIGATLLERTTRNVELTTVGRELLPLVRRMLDEFDSELFSMKDIGGSRSGLISLACVPSAAFHFLPCVMALFNLQFPNIRFKILDSSAKEGLRSVANGEVEFGINLLGAADPELTFDPLLEDPFVLVCLRHNNLARKLTIDWRDLEGQPLIALSRTSGNRSLLDAALLGVGSRLNWQYEVMHLSTSLGLVEAGLGVSVLPKLATPRAHHPLIVTRPIKNPDVSRTIGVVRRPGSRLSPAAEHFLEMLLGTWKVRQPGFPGRDVSK